MKLNGLLHAGGRGWDRRGRGLKELGGGFLLALDESGVGDRHGGRGRFLLAGTASEEGGGER
jgi:hypothetical protein